MTEFVNRIDEVLKKKNLKRAALCADLGLSATAITDWARRNTIPAADIALKIAAYLNVSLEWLITGKEGALSLEEREVLEKWRSLDENGKSAVLAVLETFCLKAKENFKKDLA